jgi:hypothetical protein
VEKVIQLHGKKVAVGWPLRAYYDQNALTTYKRYRNFVLKRNISVIKLFEDSLFIIPVSQLGQG